MDLTIHEGGGESRSCPGPTRSGYCALQLADGLLPECRPVPCAGRTVTVNVMGRRSTWEVSPGVTRCFIPALGGLLHPGPDGGLRAAAGLLARDAA